jgi:hypothetical protein
MNATAPADKADKTDTTARWASRWQRFSAASVRAFHAYANWLVGISWRRFIVLSLLLVVTVAIVHDSPPFTWTFKEEVEDRRPRVVIVPSPPAVPKPPKAAVPPQAPQAPAPAGSPAPEGDAGVDIRIGKDGIRITPRSERPAPAASAASAAEAAAEQARQAAAAAASAAARSLSIQLPPGEVSQAVREALAEAQRELEQALREAREDAAQAARDAAEAQQEAQRAIAEALGDEPRSRKRTTRVGIGDVMMQFTFLFIVASAILKFTYKGRLQAEVQAKKASATAEAESLKRQVVEARMAAMQAQVEPHFLFNTLASIDHLIETDPARASAMQKNLIALLRASMPTMREANDGGVRDLGRELAVIRPYLEILKVRMEERLTTEIAVPEGLLSAEFPPMMIQTLVENAIKHGLEPKAEGGHLRVAAEIVHGKLQVTVADTGLGFGKAATAGTGVGLANIRERLQLLYGPKATLTVAENPPGGTVVTITVPYKTVEGSVA